MAVSCLSPGCVLQVSLAFLSFYIFRLVYHGWRTSPVPPMRFSPIFYKIKHVDTVKCVISADSVIDYFTVQSLISRHFLFLLLRKNLINFFSELIVDEYFIEICQQSKTDEIDFQEDGGWKEYHEKKKDNDRPVVEKKKPAPIIHSKFNN